MPATDFALKGSASVDLSGLDRHILDMTQFTGRTVKEETRIVFKGMVRDALNFTPPGSSKAQGVAAKRAGENAIVRDFHRIGFQPVQIKGFRMLTHVYGHKLETPIRVKTKENPRFADPAAIHRQRMQSKHSGRVTQGGKQAWYVSRTKLNALKKKLFDQVGLLASGWAKAAEQLGVPIPGYIKRHAGKGRGTDVVIVETKSTITMRVTNHFPDTASALAADMTRRIETFIKPQAARRLQRQLKSALSGGWSKTKR